MIWNLRRQMITVGGAAVFLAMMLAPIYSAHALTCNPGVSHCYATEGKPTTTTHGNKFTVSVPNIGGTSGTNFGTTETWIRFPDGDWIETGILQGYLDGSGTKSDEWMFAANFLMGVWQSAFLEDISSGTIYTFEYEDEDGDYIWDARLNGVSKFQRIITWSRGTGADVGAEISHDSITIPKTRLYDVSHHNGSTHSYWSGANFFGTIPSSTSEIHIENHNTTPYRSFCVGTSSISDCP